MSLTSCMALAQMSGRRHHRASKNQHHFVHRRVRSQVAKLLKHAPPLFKKVSLELGGKNPNVIFGGRRPRHGHCRISVRSSFANQGQVCLCGSRVFVRAFRLQGFRRPVHRESVAIENGRSARREKPTKAQSQARHSLRRLSSTSIWAQKEGGKVALGGQSAGIDQRTLPAMVISSSRR